MFIGILDLGGFQVEPSTLPKKGVFLSYKTKDEPIEFTDSNLRLHYILEIRLYSSFTILDTDSGVLKASKLDGIKIVSSLSPRMPDK